jgi:hypothetical protein
MSLDGDFHSAQGSTQRPSCQVAGCFEPASVYVVIRETDVNILTTKSDGAERLESNDPVDINAFKLILYLCARHDYDLKYLLKENELEISKRRHLVLKEAG